MQKNLIIVTAYLLYFIVLGIAAGLYDEADTHTASILVLVVLTLHFAFAAWTARAELIGVRYCNGTARASVAVATDTILTVDFIVAILWQADIIAEMWGAYAIAAAFIGNVGCVYLQMTDRPEKHDPPLLQ